MAGQIDHSADPAVINFQNYLRIRCVHPDIKYDDCLAFLRAQAASLALPTRAHPLPGGLSVLVITWEGLEPTLPSILLNSHMDVVPAEGEWKHPPFAAVIEDGVIYGRGAQDMKSVTIQYLEAIRRLKTQGVRLKRTVHLSFVPEEEKGGAAGMGEFVKTQGFRELNAGFALDEGLANAGEELVVYNGEKSMWHVKIMCSGTAGHGSMLLPNNSGEKMRYMIDKFMDLRDLYRQQLVDHASWTIGEITTINLTKLEGGIQTNIVPETLTATFDIRLATTANHELFEAMIARWCREAGGGVRCQFEHKDPHVPATPLDASNPYWLAMAAAIKAMGIPLLTRTMPCTTDARFLRGARALNFSPARRVPPAPHTRNESLPLDVFLHGISVYEGVLKAVANV